MTPCRLVLLLTLPLAALGLLFIAAVYGSDVKGRK